MIIRIPRDDSRPTLTIEQLALNVSRNTYSGNLTVDVTLASASSKSETFRVKIGARTGGQGSRRSHSGRRGPWACWHVFRDVLDAMFEEYPGATVRTAFITYQGRADFLRNFPETAYRNAGSQFYPVNFVDLCACEAFIDEDRDELDVLASARAVMFAAEEYLTDCPAFDAIGLPVLH